MKSILSKLSQAIKLADNISTDLADILDDIQEDLEQLPIYQLVAHYIDDDSGRWASKHIAHSLSINTLKAKTVERKDIFDEVWVLNEQQNWQLEVGSGLATECFIISPITLL